MRAAHVVRVAGWHPCWLTRVRDLRHGAPKIGVPPLESCEHYGAQARFSSAETMTTPPPPTTPAPARPQERAPRVLMLGMGWFPRTLGGLNRYYRSLFEQLPEARGVVIGPAEDAPASVSVVDDAQTPLPRRLLDFLARRAPRRCGRRGTRRPLRAVRAAPLLLRGALRGRPLVFHFHGPWAQENVAAGDSSRRACSCARRSSAACCAAQTPTSCCPQLSQGARRALSRAPVGRTRVVTRGSRSTCSRRASGDARARARWASTRSAFVAVCVRRLVPRMGLDVLLDAWGGLAEELPERLAAAARRRRPAARRAVRARGGERRCPRACACWVASPRGARRRLPRRRRGGRAERGPGGLWPGRARGGGVRHAEHRQRRRRAAGGGAPARPLAGRRAGRRRERWASASGGGRERSAADAGGHAQLRRALLLAAPGRAPPRALPAPAATASATSACAWCTSTTSRGCPAGEIALMRLLTHLENVNPARDPRRGRPARRAPDAGGRLRRGPADRALRARSAPGHVRPGGDLAADARCTRSPTSPGWPLRLRALRADIVHTNSLKAGVYGSLAAKARRHAARVARARPHRRGLPAARGGPSRADADPPLSPTA